MTDIHAGTAAITMTFQSDPFMDDPEGASDYYAALGRAVFTWGRFESAFVNCLLIVSQLPGACDLSATLPLEWKRRRAFWEAAFGQLAPLDTLKKTALRLLPDIKDAVDDRHMMFHGTFNRFVAGDPVTAELKTMRMKGQMLHFETRHITIGHLQRFTERVDHLNSRLIPIFFGLLPLQSVQPEARKA
jgi:hypothetical protein